MVLAVAVVLEPMEMTAPRLKVVMVEMVFKVLSLEQLPITQVVAVVQAIRAMLLLVELAD
jgi:hypothetical protein